MKYGYSDLNPMGSPRRAAWPVDAIAREICDHSSSSVKIVGVLRVDASQKKSASSARPTTANGHRGEKPVEEGAPASSLRPGAEDDARIEVDVAPDEPAVDSRLGACVDDRVEPVARGVGDRDEDDVRLLPLEQPCQLVHRRRATGTPCTRRRRSRGLSSMNPTTRSPGVSRSSRIRLRPVRPAPTMSDASPAAVAQRRPAADHDARSANREPAIATVQKSASMTKNEREKSPNG